MSTRLIVLAIPVLAVFIAASVWFVVMIERAPVSRQRLELFARRHGLVVTAGNGNHVIRYLAVTRRWRATGLATALLTGIAWNATNAALRLDFLALLAGWLTGALIAELRFARTPLGSHHGGPPTRRRPEAYLPRAAWTLLPIAGAISLAVAAASAVAARAGRPVGTAAGPLLVAAMAVVIAVRLVQLRVLHRPEPTEEPDLLAADEAIRSRALHVLAGGGAALALYCVLGQLEALAEALPGAGAQVIFTVNLLGLFLVPLLGYLVATARWPIRRDDVRSRL